ncbi:hypothetical protein ACFWJY_00255 [Streptomyces anulatus]|uniref:hypothetical protein n=1 Tax=Streptomyces anulatus TaxID=1892 RepID=UPI003665507F
MLPLRTDPPAARWLRAASLRNSESETGPSSRRDHAITTTAVDHRAEHQGDEHQDHADGHGRRASAF